jgi:hypothetical protein
MRKTFVIFMAIFTLGIYVPPISPNADAAGQKDVASNPNNNESAIEVVEIRQERSDSTKEIDYAAVLAERAQVQTMIKLGSRIMPQIEDEFTNIILPTIEEVITTVVAQAEEDAVPYYAITEHPPSGLGERIFNVYDERNKENIAKFHVRREKRPLEGYWFNFHYHLNDDDFVRHHQIGDVYWDKNIPPRWMT